MKSLAAAVEKLHIAWSSRRRATINDGLCTNRVVKPGKEILFWAAVDFLLFASGGCCAQKKPRGLVRLLLHDLSLLAVNRRYSRGNGQQLTS